MRYQYLDDFRRGISVFVIFSYGIAVLGTPQCPPRKSVKKFFSRTRLNMPYHTKFWCRSLVRRMRRSTFAPRTLNSISLVRLMKSLTIGLGLSTVYCMMWLPLYWVSSVLEYSSVVWATCLPRFLIDQLEAIQKRALRIVYPDLHYQQALEQANITSLEDRRAHLCLKVWHNIKNNPDGQLHRLLPPVRSECHSDHLRNSSSSSRFQYRTKRFGSSFFPAMAKIN